MLQRVFVPPGRRRRCRPVDRCPRRRLPRRRHPAHARDEHQAPDVQRSSAPGGLASLGPRSRRPARTFGAATTLTALGREPRLPIPAAGDASRSPPRRSAIWPRSAAISSRRHPYGDLAVGAAGARRRGRDRRAGRGAARRRSPTCCERRGAPGEIVTSVSVRLPEPGTWFYTKAHAAQAQLGVRSSRSPPDRGRRGNGACARGSRSAAAGPRPIRARGGGGGADRPAARTRRRR